MCGGGESSREGGGENTRAARETHFKREIRGKKLLLKREQKKKKGAKCAGKPVSTMPVRRKEGGKQPGGH